MNSKQKATLKPVFDKPPRSDIPWRDIEGLFRALGGTVEQTRGSRVCVELNGVVATFHEPHPHRVTDKGAVVSVRKFLESAGVEP